MPTLYVTREDGTLGRRGGALCWRSEQSAQSPLPINQIDSVVILGQGNVTTQALHMLMEADIPVHYIDASGRYKGSLTSGRGRGYALRKLQYGAAGDPEACLDIAKGFVTGKLLGERRTLQRYMYRDRGDIRNLQYGSNTITHFTKSVLAVDNMDNLRGLEGIAAAKYFEALSGVFMPPWLFRERNRRPPKDPVNAMLSFCYTLLLGSVSSAVIVAGLDPCVGFLHPEYRGRPSLALDLMEEFRSPVVDRMVVAGCNQGIFNIEDFQSRGGEEGVIMNALVKQALLKLYNGHLRVSVRNESNGEQSTFENHIRNQAALLVCRLRGESDYLPFVQGK